MSTRPQAARTRFLRAIRTGELRCALGALRAEDRVVLEIGGGQGWQARQLERRGYEVYSIDVARHPDSCEDSPVMLYDGHRIPFADECFDVVFSSNVLEHIAHLDAFESELQRVLRPGGIAIHVLPTPVWRLWTSLTHPARVLRAAMARLGTSSAAGDGDARGVPSATLLRYIFWPNRHGERGNSLSEFCWFFATRLAASFHGCRLVCVGGKTVPLLLHRPERSRAYCQSASAADPGQRARRRHSRVRSHSGRVERTTGEKAMSAEDPFTPHPVEWNEENTNRLWNFYSSLPAMEKRYFGARVGRHVARTLKRLGLLSSVRRVVDFSCGTGSLIAACVPLLPNGACIVGLDPSTRSVAATEVRNRGAEAFGGARVIDALPSSLPEGDADLVLLTEVVEHLSEQRLDEILAECLRILAPGGHLFVTTPNGEDLDVERTICPECGCTFHRWQHVRSWTAQSLAKRLSVVGFAPVETREIAWGNELIELGFSLLGRKKTGIYAVATKPSAATGQH